MDTKKVINRTTAVYIRADDVPTEKRQSVYPEPFASQMVGREKRKLGDLFGLTNFGVNQTTLAPGAVSALRHSHTVQDEFLYILKGRPTLHDNNGKTELSPGMCAGFRAATGNACRLINETNEPVVYLEIGDRKPGDGADYPDDDICAKMVEGQWAFTHKDGTPY